jgi:hypothetical protein
MEMDTSPLQPPGISKPTHITLSQVDEEWLDIHLRRIRKLITDDAFRIANARHAQAPEGLDVAEATRRFAPGKKFPADGLWARTQASLSGVTVVSAVMVFLFGLMGILVGRGQLAYAGTASAYFDIAKLFAGAIVGSTGAGAVLDARRN